MQKVYESDVTLLLLYTPPCAFVSTTCLLLPLNPQAAPRHRQHVLLARNLVAVLLLLLLELSEMGLNGGGRLLDLDGAQRWGGWHVRHDTDPVGDVGV